MNESKKLNICPKAKRCKYGATCINFDSFRGEYLCFESKVKRRESKNKK